MPLLSAYIVLLFLTATIRDFGLTSIVAHNYGDIASAFVEPLWKLPLWVLPALLSIRVFCTREVAGYLRLNSNIGKGLLWGLAGGSFFCLSLLSNLLARHPLSFNHSFDSWLNGVLLVGLIEETVFRGFLFQQLQIWFMQSRWIGALPHLTLKEVDELKEEGIDLLRWIPSWSTLLASSVSTLLFVAIHFPYWILTHEPMATMVITSLFNLFLGYVLCFSFSQSQSLWSCILIHMINNLALLLT